ncbi:MAG: hypothetical protein ACK55I_29715, partial [bacterium]
MWRRRPPNAGGSGRGRWRVGRVGQRTHCPGRVHASGRPGDAWNTERTEGREDPESVPFSVCRPTSVGSVQMRVHYS